jgi:hypothetical protein
MTAPSAAQWEDQTALQACDLKTTDEELPLLLLLLLLLPRVMVNASE